MVNFLSLVRVCINVCIFMRQYLMCLCMCEYLGNLRKFWGFRLDWEEMRELICDLRLLYGV